MLTSSSPRSHHDVIININNIIVVPFVVDKITRTAGALPLIRRFAIALEI
jgi:hypothetical protein